MEKSTNLQLPFIMAAQAQKHVTHNEALQKIDVLSHLAVLTRSLSQPPQTLVDGDRYLVPQNALGEWLAKENHIAAFQDGVWEFFEPRDGWLCWIHDEGSLWVWSSLGWQQTSGAQNFEKFGVNGDADVNNRLVVKSNAALLTHDDVTPGTGDIRLSLNKKDASSTASIVMQNNYAGRAELGLVGSDNIQLKVSQDGAGWINAWHVNSVNANICIGQFADFSRNMVIRGASPWLRISNESETESGIELVDAQVSSAQNFKIIYNSSNNAGTFEVDSVPVMSLTKDTLNPKVPIVSSKVICGEYLYTKSRALIFNNLAAGLSDPLADPLLATNIDHMWHDDANNTWHFCSDTGYKASGNSTIRASSFATSSDYRLKSGINSLSREKALKRLTELRPVEFYWRDEKQSGRGSKCHGFLAHEVARIVPNAVSGTEDGMDESSGDPLYQSVDYDRVLPTVIAALQAVTERLEKIEKMLL